MMLALVEAARNIRNAAVQTSNAKGSDYASA